MKMASQKIRSGTLYLKYIYMEAALQLQCNHEERESKAVCGVVDILVGSSCYLLFSRTSKGLLNLLDRPFIACRGKLFALLAAKRPKKVLSRSNLHT